MELFRITSLEFAKKLFAPGFPGRWNRSGEKVLYAASSRSLACLENIVHRNINGTTKSFRTMVIYIPDRASVNLVNLSDLSDDWNQTPFFQACQEIGCVWYREKQSLLLRVPSAVIPDEHNYLIHTLHPDFNQVRLIHILPFFFDKRL